MNNSRIAEIEEQTLQVFKRVNPTLREYTRADEICQSLRRREETILANLGFEPAFFQGKTVLDAGCGTGDMSFLLADWGAHIHGFDLNEVSIHHAQRMARQLGLETRCEFKVGNVFAPPFEGIYDFVQCLGVLPHTGDPELAFGKLAQRVKAGGYFYVSTINTYGFALRAFKRAIVHMLGRGDPDRKARWAKILWKGHIQRAAKFGLRTEEQIAYDNFVAPHITTTVGDWMRWLRDNDLEYVSSYPSFFSPRLPSHRSGGIEVLRVQQDMPKSKTARAVLTALVQLHWAVAFRVGGMASISFVGRRRVY